MPRPKGFDVDQALERAMETFWEKGYEAASLDDLTRRMGIRKASLYGTFGDKKQLFLATLARYQDDWLAHLGETLDGNASPRAAIAGLFAEVVAYAGKRGGSRGCLCANTAVELAPHDADVAKAMRRHGERVEALMRRTLERGKAQGEFAKRLDSAAVARFLVNALNGLHVSAKTAPPKKKLQDVVAVTLSVLDS